jgi:Flp pilus assembly protein TadG
MMAGALDRMRRRLGTVRRDRGSVSILFVVGVTMSIMIIGVSVDGGGQIRGRQQAADIAAEAARSGGQALDLSKAIPGITRQIDPAAARTAVDSYIATVKTVAGVDIPNAPTITFNATYTQITVVVTLVYHTTILTVVGLHALTVTGAATASLLTTTPTGTVV